MSTSLPSAKHRASRRGVTRTTARVAATMKPDSKVQPLKRWAPASSLLVILHYLLKNNIEDFNTRCCKNQLSGPLGFLPMFVGGSRANGRISA